MLSENEKALIAILDTLGAENELTAGLLTMLDENAELKDKNYEKLFGYIYLKGKYVTPKDILSKVSQITLPREQHLPPNMWIRCIVKGVPGISFDSIYQVGISYDGDQNFVICDDNDKEKEYPGEYFEMQDVSAAVYVGCKEEDGSIKVTDGFVLNQEYKINGIKFGKYQLDDGRECFFYEFEPTEFVKRRKREPFSFRTKDSDLHILRAAFEFGDCRNLRVHLNEETRYVSQDAGLELKGKKDIIAHLKKVAAAQLEKNIFIDCAYAVVTKSLEGNRFPVGTQCMPIYEADGCHTVVFSTTRDAFYEEICILTEPYEFELQ